MEVCIFAPCTPEPSMLERNSAIQTSQAGPAKCQSTNTHSIGSAHVDPIFASSASKQLVTTPDVAMIDSELDTTPTMDQNSGDCDIDTQGAKCDSTNASSVGCDVGADSDYIVGEDVELCFGDREDSEVDPYQVAFDDFYENYPVHIQKWWMDAFQPEFGTLESTFPQIDWNGEDANSIQRDVVRTFPLSKLFTVVDGMKRMANINAGYAVRNIEVGYCQGMNYVVGYLLMALERFFPDRPRAELDQKVFHLLAHIVESEKYNHKYYTHVCGYAGPLG